MGEISEVTRGGGDDEVVATVADDAAARPVVEALLLAGLGPALRPGRGGVEVTVVAGQGGRAREVLGASDPGVSPLAGVDPFPEPATGGAEWSSPSAGAAARAARHQGELEQDELADRPRYSMLKILVLFAVACIVFPLIAFYISYRVAGG